MVAHRDRLTYLTKLLGVETARVCHKRREPRIFNMGCGPAKEIQDFLTGYGAAQRTHFTLIDFNEETVKYTASVFANIKRSCGSQAQIQFVKKSVNQVIKEALKFKNDALKYDVVYCAGLFDYLPDPVCKRLLDIFHDMVAPGGLLIATNVVDPNPSRNWMDYVLDWHLIYRNSQNMAALAPEAGQKDLTTVRSVGSGVNLFLEVRKPEDAQ